MQWSDGSNSNHFGHANKPTGTTTPPMLAGWAAFSRVLLRNFFLCLCSF